MAVRVVSTLKSNDGYGKVADITSLSVKRRYVPKADNIRFTGVLTCRCFLKWFRAENVINPEQTLVPVAVSRDVVKDDAGMKTMGAYDIGRP